MTETPAPDPAALAKKRFFFLQALRLGGAAMALLGVAIMSGKVPAIHAGSQPELVGRLMVMIGAIDALIVPILLARAWKRQGG
ncbi:MAG: hypothetical protein JSS36_09690 [Proteobacteria bacterium]|nr:hypothetical protein [Pseudomonadota bacterium]